MPKQGYQDSVVCTEDLSAVVRLAERSIRGNIGRPQKYEDSPEGLERFLAKCADFFNYCEEINSAGSEKKLIPDIESLCAYLSISRKTLSEYHNKRGEDWEQGIDLVRDSILAVKKQLVLSGRCNPVLFIFDSVNNHGYRSVNQVQIVTEPPSRETVPRLDTNQIGEIIGQDIELPQLPDVSE